MFRCIVSTFVTIPICTTNRRCSAVMILITTTSIVVVTFARTLRPVLPLMCKEDLFRFQLKFLDLLTDLGESLLGVLEIEVCHWWLVVVTVCPMASAGLRRTSRKLEIEFRPAQALHPSPPLPKTHFRTSHDEDGDAHAGTVRRGSRITSRGSSKAKPGRARSNDTSSYPSGNSSHPVQNSLSGATCNCSIR